MLIDRGQEGEMLLTHSGQTSGCTLVLTLGDETQFESQRDGVVQIRLKREDVLRVMQTLAAMLREGQP